MTLTVTQWRLLLAGECAACELCGGTGERDLWERGKVTRSGRYVGEGKVRRRPCVACKWWRQLLAVLAPSRADVEQARLEDEAFEDAARLNAVRGAA